MYQDRSEKKCSHDRKSMTFWFTGLSAAGKTTLANECYKVLSAKYSCYVLDGDRVRQGLCRDLDFSLESRSENIRRVAEVAKLMNDAGLMVFVALISPLRADREMARQIIGDDCFSEIYVSTPLNVCESRDPKGLYAQARNGSILNFTGIDSPYEEPVSPDCIVDTSLIGVHDSVSRIISLI